MTPNTHAGRIAATIVDAEPERQSDGTRTCTVVLKATQRRNRARIFPTSNGDWFPYRKGDPVWVVMANGDPRAGVHVVGYRGTSPSPESANNREIHHTGTIRIVAASGDVLIRLGSDGTARIEAEGDVEVTTQGAVTVDAQGDVDVTTPGTVTVEGATINLGDGASLGVARETDDTKIDNLTDPTFWQFLTALAQAWSTAEAVAYAASSASPLLVPAPPDPPSAISITSITGEITGSSGTVKAVD